MKCIKCGSEYPSSYYFATQEVCKECFENLSGEEQKELLDLESFNYPTDYSAYPGRVGFGLRFAAHLIDFVILSVIMFIAIVYTGVIDP
ncbi:MAG: hypothetical protein KAH48_11415, partial [Chlorobi bacterium]|nr:hypothetical protein [Chlorobiota bacterium]